MRSQFVAVFIITYLAYYCDAAKRSKSKETNPKMAADERLRSLNTKYLTTNMVSLHDSNFSKFVTLRPRDYVAVLMFTALDARYNCEVCKASLPTFREVAALYYGQFDFNSSLPKDRLAFFIVDAGNAGGTFDDLKIETVPRFYVLPPRSEADSKLKMSDFEISNREVINGKEGLISQIERFANVKITVTVDPRPLLAILGSLSVIVALLISAASTDLDNALFWYRNQYLWMAVSVVCFCVGVSGSIYCYIRGAPNYGMEERGMLRVFAGPGRDQYFVEGLIVAAWTVGCALAGISMLASTKIPFSPIRHVMVILSLSVFIVLGIQIWEAYVDKTRWYQMKDTVPPGLWKYFSSSVKKSSGIIKRLIRVSEIWLYEYKDFNGFLRRANILVGDYLKRFLFKSSGSSN